MAVSEHDKFALQTMILRVISDPDFRTTFTASPEKAIEISGLDFSVEARAALIANAAHATGLTEKMDNVHAAFFFFYHGGNS